MKILAFSDLHKDKSAAEEIIHNSHSADVLVGAGDFATCGEGAEDTINILKSIKIPTILVSGNHDNHKDLTTLCSHWPNSHLLHGNSTVIEGVSFFGLGFEIPKNNDFHWNEFLSEEDAAKLLMGCPINSVLVTHTPPYGICDLQKDESHEGSKAILDVVKKKQPILNLCGHIHHSWGTSEYVGSCQVKNLGPSINWIEIP